MSLRIR